MHVHDFFLFLIFDTLSHLTQKTPSIPLSPLFSHQIFFLLSNITEPFLPTSTNSHRNFACFFSLQIKIWLKRPSNSNWIFLFQMCQSISSPWATTNNLRRWCRPTVTIITTNKWLVWIWLLSNSKAFCTKCNTSNRSWDFIDWICSRRRV